MKKSVKKLITATLAISMLSSVAMPVFADEEIYDVTSEINIGDIVDGNIGESSDINDYYDYFAPDITARIEHAKSNVNIIDNYGVTETLYDGYRHSGLYENAEYGLYGVIKAPNGRYFFGYVVSSDIEERLAEFKTKNVDNVSYVNLDGNWWEYYLDAEYNTLYLNIPGIDYIRVVKQSITEEDYNNYFTIANKYYAYMTSPLIKDVIYLVRGGGSMMANLDKANGNKDLAIKYWAEELASWDMTLYMREHGAEEDFDFHLEVGDLDADGEVGIKDLGILKKYLTGQIKLSQVQRAIASTNGEAEPDIRDVTRMNQYLVKTIDEL